MDLKNIYTLWHLVGTSCGDANTLIRLVFNRRFLTFLPSCNSWSCGKQTCVINVSNGKSKQRKCTLPIDQFPCAKISFELQQNAYTHHHMGHSRYSN